ncbi:MAG: hypothetical protein HY765_05520 [Rhodomicrobium sp.]|nr:hypothetical protein [Rhodomicrobium sp.]
MIDFSGFTAEIFSGVAVLVSGYSLWQTSLRRADLQVFVPPLIRYASPYQNSIFEVFEIPLTIINEGARTGTVLSLNLEVTDPQTGVSKHFYSAGLGTWSLAKSQGEGLLPFMPLSLAGHTSQSAAVLFYAREDSRVPQVVERAGHYKFVMHLLTARREGFFPLGGSKSEPLIFEMCLPYMDHRAFTGGSGTLPLHHPDWQTATSEN